MAATRRATPARSGLEPPSNVVSYIELVDHFQRRSVLELVIVEFAPGLYRLEAILAWRLGRWTLMGARTPRQFRSVDTLLRQVKTMGGARTITRIELLS